MVVVLAIVPNQLDVIECLLDEAVLLTSELLEGSAQVHGVLNDESIVREAQT